MTNISLFFHFTYGDNFYTCMSFLKPFVNILFLGKKKKKGGGGKGKKVGGKSCCNPSTGHTMCWRLAYMLRLYTAMELWLY
jgi:hypothetical protein